MGCRHRLLIAGSVLALLGARAAVGVMSDKESYLEILSSRPDMVSGGETLVRIRPQASSLVAQMDRWLDAIAADQAPGALPAQVIRDKPGDVASGCQATDGEDIREPAVYSRSGRCKQLYPPHADPRIAAGGPLIDNVLKCRLKPVEPTDYTQPLTADQLQRLKAIFPKGVCDYTRPGVGQEVTRAVWQQF